MSCVSKFLETDNLDILDILDILDCRCCVRCEVVMIGYVCVSAYTREITSLSHDTPTSIHSSNIFIT